ncbi:Syntaxin-binding protein 5 [Sparganum proliferum]
MTSKSRKLLKVIDGLRAWNLTSYASSNNHRTAIEIKEHLRSDHFQLGQIAVHGFPHQPSCMAFEPVQRILAIGTKDGSIRLFGRPGVDFHLNHPSQAAVIQLIFLVNEGGLISICQDDVVHLWNFRQKPPEITHSLQFKREKLTCGHLSVGSSWLCVGSDKGNVHFVNTQQFTISGYVINWNKAIDM